MPGAFRLNLGGSVWSLYAYLMYLIHSMPQRNPGLVTLVAEPDDLWLPDYCAIKAIGSTEYHSPTI